MTSVPEPSPLFIVGSYRSGTTLLYAIANQHPAIALMYECDALAVPGVAPTRARSPRWLHRNELWNQVLSRHRLSSAKRAQAHDLRTLYARFAQRSGAVFYGEKSPAYARWLGKLARNFPDARLIVVLRELPEIYQSMLDAGNNGARFFHRRGQLPRLIWSHRALMRGARRLQQAGFPVLWLRYREAVSDARAVAHRICDFLGLEFDEAMSSLVGSDLSAVYQAPHHDWARSEKIIRRTAGRTKVSPALQIDLRLFAQRSGQSAFTPAEQLPSPSFNQIVRYYLYLAIGFLLCSLDDAKRALYEFLPAGWFVKYRGLRNRSAEDPIGAGIGQRSD